MEYDEYMAMNTTIQVAAEGDRSSIQPGFERVRHFIAECESRFSRFRQDSELTSLNRSSGKWFTASAGLFDLIQEVLDLHQITNGLFDPSILPSLMQADYDRSMDEIRSSGTMPAMNFTPPFQSRLAESKLDPEKSAVYLPSGVQIDLGGIAKGWIAEKATHLLSEYTSACAVSAGGDIFFQGTPVWEHGWNVALEDPYNENDVLAILQIQNGAVATSSTAKRRWVHGDQVRHHIIDPHTGNPAETEWVSVCVGAPKATAAEAFATALLIGGSPAGTKLAAKTPGLWFIAVNPDGSLCGTEISKEVVYEPV